MLLSFGNALRNFCQCLLFIYSKQLLFFLKSKKKISEDNTFLQESDTEEKSFKKSIHEMPDQGDDDDVRRASEEQTEVSNEQHKSIDGEAETEGQQEMTVSSVEGK